MAKSQGKPTNLSAQAVLIDISHCIRIVILFGWVDDDIAVFFPNGEGDLQVMRLSGKIILNSKESTLVITTISSRGSLCCLIAFPRIISERPLEYT